MRNLYNIKIKKKSSHTENKRDWKNLSEIDESYFEAIKTKIAFNGNYIEYERKGVNDKNLLPREYLHIIRPYLSNMINDYKTIREWKIQLTIQINFISHKDSEETCTIYTKTCNIDIMEGDETDEIIEELFEYLLQNYQKELEGSHRGSEFIFDTIDLFCYYLQNVDLKRSGWYSDSPKWLKNKKITTNPQNNDANCFQYDLTVALNHQNITNNPQGIFKTEFSNTLKRLEKFRTKQ